MLKFSVSQRKLPAHYMKQTMVNLSASSPIGQEKRRRMHGQTISSSSCEVWKEGPTTPAVVIRRNHQTPRKVLTPGRVSRHPEGGSPQGVQRRRIPVKRSETIQMKVWSSQLDRVKRKTESLRRKDDEIKERYLEIRRRAKRVISSTDFQFPDHCDDATPVKRPKLTTPSKHRSTQTKSRKIDPSVTCQRQERNCSKRSNGDLVIIMKRVRSAEEDVERMFSAHVLDAPGRRYKMPQKRHRSGSDIPAKTAQRRDFPSPVPFPRTFLKNGQKYTIC